MLATLQVLAVLLPIIFSITIELVSEKVKRHAIYKRSVLIFGLVISAVTFLQIHYDSVRSAREKESAITETSSRVAAETSKTVTAAVGEEYRKTFVAFEGLVSDLKTQLEIANGNTAATKTFTQKQLELSYIPSVVITYELGKIVVANNGRTNLKINNLSYGEQKYIDGDQREIAPGANYYFLTNGLEDQIKDQLNKAEATTATLPLYAFLTTIDGKKHTARCLLVATKQADNSLDIRTQMIGTTPGWDEDSRKK